MGVLSLVPVIEPVLGDRPWWLVLGWIDVESGGRVSDLTTSVPSLGGEASYFQLSASERATVGADLDRMLRDPAYSVQKGLEFVETLADKAIKLGIPYGTDFFWGVVKLIHGIGYGGTIEIFNDMRAHGVEPQSLEDMAQYFCGGTCPNPRTSGPPQTENNIRVAQAIKRRGGNIHYPSKWIYNAQMVYSRGQMLALAGKLTNPFVALPLLLAAGLVVWLLVKD